MTVGDVWGGDDGVLMELRRTLLWSW